MFTNTDVQKEEGDLLPQTQAATFDVSWVNAFYEKDDCWVPIVTSWVWDTNTSQHTTNTSHLIFCLGQCNIVNMRRLFPVHFAIYKWLSNQNPTWAVVRWMSQWRVVTMTSSVCWPIDRLGLLYSPPFHNIISHYFHNITSHYFHNIIYNYFTI